MLRTKVKRLMMILSIFVCASFFFVGCKDDNVKVERIKFVDEVEINLLVGDSITPEVEVAPSFASNKEYSFELGVNSGVLEIQGKTIIAVKEGTAQLKVVSNENKYINDVISIKVMSAPITLSSPNNLTFDGDRFSFNAVNDAKGYILEINGNEIKLASKTTLTLAEYADIAHDVPYDKVLEAKVKAYGDGRTTLDSTYSDEIKIKKIASPENFGINNSLLSFSKVNEVKTYKIRILNEKNVIDSLTIYSDTYSGGNVVANMSSYGDSLPGGEYVCELIDETVYENSGVQVFNFDPISINFSVLGSPTDVVLSHYVLSWTSVAGAESYSIFNNDTVIVSNIANTNYDLKPVIECIGDTTYSLKVQANTSNKTNCLSGIKFSDSVSFSILGKTEISLDLINNSISWRSVSNAVGYQVSLTNTTTGASNTFSLTTTKTFDITSLTSGEYNLKVISCGDGKSYLNSISSADVDFKILPSVQNVTIENKQISWNEISGESYSVEIVGVSGTAETVSNNHYDLSSLNLGAGDYKFVIKLASHDNSFSLNSSILNFSRLSDASELNVASTDEGVINFSIDPLTTTSDVKLYKVGDESKTITLTPTNKHTYKFNLDDLEVGEYLVEVNCFGNNKNILDAKNETQPLKITKLGLPELEIDEANKSLLLTNFVALNSYYELYENGAKVASLTDTDNGYDLSNLTANEYAYQIKSVGNGADIISSKISNTLKKVLRLSTPSINFNKATKTFSLSSNEDDYISSYEFKFDNEAMTVIDKTINCAEKLKAKVAGNYSATAYLKAKTMSELSGTSIDLVLDSVQESFNVTKINSESTLTINNGVLVVTPKNVANLNSDYRPTLKLGYRSSQSEAFTYLSYTNLTFDAKNKCYSVKILDEQYNAVGPNVSDVPVFSIGTDYDMIFLLDNLANDMIESNDFNLGTITRQKQLESITKSKEELTFTAVDGATNYKFFIDGDVRYYIDIDSTSISINDLRKKFLEAGFSMREDTEYSLGTVVMGNDSTRVLSSATSDVFSFKILPTPTATINENNIKAVKISNIVTSNTKYVVKFVDENKNVCPISLTTDGSESLSVMLKDVSGLSAGTINVEIHAETTLEQNYFNSANVNLSYIRLSAPSASLKGGIVCWDEIENSSSYILQYYKNGEFVSITLNTGVENYSQKDGKASYDLSNIEGEISRLKLQAISVCYNEDNGKYYYDSLESAVLSVKKLSNANIKAENGDMVLTFDEGELELIDRVEISRMSDNKTFDLLDFVGEMTTKNVITANKIMKYLDNNEIVEERFGFKIYAKDYDKINSYVLNSNTVYVGFKGLKTVEDLGIDTTIQADGNESVDTIVWTNNSQNLDHTSGYKVIITYKEKDYPYEVSGENNCLLLFPNVEGFCAGEYKIKIMTLANSSNNYLNSTYCSEFVFNVCETPNNIRTENGIILWDKISGAKNYLLRVFDKDETQLETLTTSKNSLDFNTLGGNYQEGMYKLSLQAINESDPSVVSSVVSPKYSFVKLPKISKFKVEMGELYVYAHSFTDKIELTLTNKIDSSKKVSFTLEQESSAILLRDDNESWEDVTNLDDLLSSVDEESDHKMAYLKFVPKGDDASSVILDCLNAGYDIDIIAIGSTGSKLMLVNSQMTHSSSENNLTNENYMDTNSVTKIQTPTLQVSTTTRGKVEWGLKDTSYSSLNYDGLEGAMIYKVNLVALGNEYSFYVIDNIDIRNLPENSKLVAYQYPSLLEEPDDWEENYLSYYEYVSGEGYVNISTSSAPNFELNKYYKYNNDNKKDYYGYLIYNDLVLNIVRFTDGTNTQNDMFIDFSKASFSFAQSEVLERDQVITLTLTEGGPFIVSVLIVGDDTHYLTSNTTSVIRIKRYKDLALTIVDGELAFENLAKRDSEDSPVFLLNIKQDNKTIMLVYLYDETKSGEFTLPIVLEGATYTDGVSYEDDRISYKLDLFENGEYLIKDGNYQISLTTYYRDSSSYEMIESRPSGDKPIVKLSTVTSSTDNGKYLVDGKLSWKQLVVGSGKFNIDNYEIWARLEDDSENIVKFRISKDDYILEDGKIYYSIPDTIIDVDGKTFEFNDEKRYVFTITALAGSDSVAYINSNPCSEFSANFANVVTDITKADGRITWESEYKEGIYEYVLTYEIDGSGTITYSNSTTNKYFILPTEILDDGKHPRELTSNYAYSFKVRRCGNNEMLSSFYLEMDGTMERLKTVNSNSILTNIGTLAWDEVKNLAGESISGLTYYLNIVYEDGSSEVINLTTNEFDFEGLKSGLMKITINTKCDGYFDSLMSDEAIIHKFAQVGDISLSEEDNVMSILSWAPVYVDGEYSNGTSYRIYADVYYLDIGGIVVTIVPSDPTNTIKVNLAEIEEFNGIDLVDGALKCKVQARSGKIDSICVNGEYSQEKSFGKVSSIDLENFKRDDLYFEWQQISDENSASDSYLLEYDLTYYNSETGNTLTQKISVELMANDSSSYITRKVGEDMVKVYRYLPTIIGTYKNITVTVNRTNAISSDPVIMKSGEINTIYAFDIYESGRGSEEDPYIISELAHLIAIYRYNSSYFKLGQNIELNDQSFNGSVIVTGEFKGHFDGDDKSITHFILKATDEKLGVFEILNNATISNLNLSNLKVEMTSQYAGKDIYFGILASKAINSVIENVSISYASTQIKIYDDNSISSSSRSFYLGGLIGKLENTTVSSCKIDLTHYMENGDELINNILISGCGGDNVYYGGIAGAIINSSILGTLLEDGSYDAYVKNKYIPTISKNNAEITLYPYVMFGGAVGFMGTNSTIENITIESSQLTNPSSANVIITVNGGVAGSVGSSAVDTNAIKNIKISCYEDGIGLGGGISNIPSGNTIYLGKIVAIKEGNVLLLNNIEEIILNYSENSLIKVNG